ncbi:PAS domain S-box-containing protein [Pseudoduganella flava]|uniref:histidine kinase n=1 Tax=Pseudoduganella flava TaxID=871742 RepID=A0A562PM21_9BURK|nr:ATP-binding protein [Pseudoduganella flava]QGZ40867.1 PAS domain S-box protein [Pseudoduganella flava]TWI45459.1 PAS domain S-box-containing protein [Pseudoduganella flava]
MNGLAQLMLDHSPSMMMLVEPAQLRIVGVNRAVEQLLGYTKAELLALTITEIESALQDVFYWEEVQNGQCGDIEAQEGQYRRADGELLTVVKSVRAIRHGDAALMLVQARDVQHEHEVEDALAQTLSRLQATLESTGNGILVIDWHGRIASMNRQFSRMWRIPEALLHAEDDAGILDWLCSQVAEADVCRARLTELVAEEETLDLFHLKGGKVFECTSRPQRLGERIIGRVFGYNDITERQLAEEALRESRDQLEARVDERTAELLTANATLEEEKARQQELIDKLGAAQNQLLQAEKMASVGVLAAGVAHEINNPIAFVNTNMGTLQVYSRGLLKLLDAYEELEGLVPADARERLQALKHEVDAEYLREDIGALLSESLEGLERVKNIVQDLKDFSHVSESDRQWANLERGLDSTLNLVANDLKYKAEVVKEYAGIPQIECLPSQLNQVFMNLLMNAGHAIAEKGRITVRTGFDKQNVWVEVEDTGHGIKPENLGRIFDPFFTTKPVGKGTGLGLALSYGIVTKHAGTIDVRSEVGKGTTFRVTLPRQQ